MERNRLWKANFQKYSLRGRGLFWARADLQRHTLLLVHVQRVLDLPL